MGKTFLLGILLLAMVLVGSGLTKTTSSLGLTPEYASAVILADAKMNGESLNQVAVNDIKLQNGFTAYVEYSLNDAKGKNEVHKVALRKSTRGWSIYGHTRKSVLK